MAYIAADADFDVLAHDAPVVGIASDLGPLHDSLVHQHARDQLLFAASGCMSVTLDHQWLTLPPTRAAWIPAGVPHRVQLRGAVAYRSLYVMPEVLPARGLLALPERALVFAVNPLLQAMIERMALADFDFDWGQPAAQHLLQVWVDELAAAKVLDGQLSWPQHPRVQQALARYDAGWVLPSLTVLAEETHLHSKTLTRVFQRDTGLSYQQWVQQWRLQRAIEALAEAQSVSTVAQQLAFASDSAFIAFFKRQLGVTPKQFVLGLSGR
ncbi:MAG: helix-turn-helix transcriptional regulator [Neisseriaceae bacterium]|nr:helix-turn-helix transcriptional regulator [Neisseriaceae bacterium]MBP6861657.1 helix-turn-helix transcriptional regulator [Neisseriaceae bacterium]